MYKNYNSWIVEGYVLDFVLAGCSDPLELETKLS